MVPDVIQSGGWVSERLDIAIEDDKTAERTPDDEKDDKNKVK